MSLLDRGRDEVEIYLELEPYEDEDGNIRNRVSDTPIHATASIQVKGQSGTAARRAEQDNEGFESEEVYRMRLPRSFPHILGARSYVIWRGEKFAVFGKPQYFNGSPRTAHIDYTIKRY